MTVGVCETIRHAGGILTKMTPSCWIIRKYIPGGAAASVVISQIPGT